ncbi:RNA 2'-phosphotransferase [Halopelagius longus]|uniref:Probable RNA 2'-phosphotransferase n=1 Tax=Halopelagius longus TaxID=1236180 RepID=A0A1H0XSI8_9EURY|nr:RNA 2'-phosphotransferase [Halopelagius longus]RDI72047.1 RNA 2'-phosphotransferase [Halopelagius longus]SDQ05636.1 putative RNA 2'-phosphotransferase [Halopelagius longus]
MGAIRRCRDHGFFDGDACPVCGVGGRVVLSSERRTRLSKFVSGALRHFPDDAGITVSEAGWAEFADLLAAVERKYDWADEEALRGVVATDPKGRFERDDGRIRAAYGHSIDVDLDADAGDDPEADADADDPIPDVLYHGTAPRNLDAIREEGLKPMNRREVHLSESVEEAREVGSRHAPDPAVLRVDAAGLRESGREIRKRGKAVYTTERVPPTHLTVLSDGE